MRKSASFINVDVFRVILAQSVICCHVLPEIFHIAALPGRTPVLAFFIASGFLNYLSFDRRCKHSDWMSATMSYFRGRAIRIYPLLIFSYVFVGITIGAAIHTDWITILPFKLFVREELHNGPLWTLVVELQLYFLTPVLFILVPMLRNQAAFTATAVLAGVVGIAIPVGLAIGLGDRSLIDDRSVLSALPFYWFGMAIARSRINIQKFPKRMVRTLWAYFYSVAFIWSLRPTSAFGSVPRCLKGGSSRLLQRFYSSHGRWF